MSLSSQLPFKLDPISVLLKCLKSHHTSSLSEARWIESGPILYERSDAPSRSRKFQIFPVGTAATGGTCHALSWAIPGCQEVMFRGISMTPTFTDNLSAHSGKQAQVAQARIEICGRNCHRPGLASKSRLYKPKILSVNCHKFKAGLAHPFRE